MLFLLFSLADLSGFISSAGKTVADTVTSIKSGSYYPVDGSSDLYAGVPQPVPASTVGGISLGTLAILGVIAYLIFKK